MENDTTLSKEGLLEPVLPGSVTFDNSILAPLRNSYLCEESRQCFAYNSANLINNVALQRRYSSFRTEKQENGYYEEELEESFGFLLFNDESEANKLADTGLTVGRGKCTTLGDSSKGVYVSKYSDCLDLKRWYDGKTGYIVILKLTKGRVKEVTENYTQNFTAPTAGFDSHVSEQHRTVCASTSSFLAFERTQYYMYELLDGGSTAEAFPRHVCPFAIVAFSYGKTATSLELKEKSQEKPSFHYQPWSGQLKIESMVYDVGLKSIHGAMFPANLPKTVNVNHAIGVSELRKTLPEAIFETSLVGEVCLDGRCFNLYDVVSCEARSDVTLLAHELKKKEVALVIYLDDNGFLILLHTSHFLSFEGAETDKASALQGMFIFPDSRMVPRETKIGYSKSKVSAEVLQVLPALNYAESEMEKCPPGQQGEPLGIVERHLQNFATLFFPGLSSIPAREASMFPDQYDVPDGFPLIAPKWTEVAGARLKTYMKNPDSFQISTKRTLELLAAGKQQRGDDHDDDVYYYISSPEETPQTPFAMVSERDATDDVDRVIDSSIFSDEEKNTREQQAEKQNNVTADLPQDIGTASVVGAKRTEWIDASPKSQDLPTHNLDSEKTSHSNAVNEKCIVGSVGVSEEPHIQSSSVALISLPENGNDVSAKPIQCNLADAEKVNHKLDFLKVGEQMPDVDKEIAGLTVPVSPPVTSDNQTDTLTGGCVEAQPQIDSDVTPHTTLNLKLLPRRRGRRKKRGFKRNANKAGQTAVSIVNTTSPSCSSLEASCEQSSNSEAVISSPSTPPPKKDWRSLPRRKRHWNADKNLKRILRSDVKTTETKSIEDNNSEDNGTELSLAGHMTSTPKRKMEGCSMKERYGLKTIVTDCGRVFVPHGSDAAPGDVKSPENTTEEHDSSIVTEKSPSKEQPSTPTLSETHAKSLPLEMEKISQQVPLGHIQNIPVITSSQASQQETVEGEKDDTSHNNSDQSLDSQPTSTEKSKGKIKDNVYRAISISKLKTVLKRARMSKSPGPGDHGKSLSDNAEPEVKKSKPDIDVNLKSSSGNSSPHKEHSVSKENSESAGNPEPTANAQAKLTLVSWRELKNPSQEGLISEITKENRCISLDTSPTFAVVKQADHQLMSTLTDDRAGGKNISSDGKSCKGGPSLPSDALNLLADLALGANSDKMANLGEKLRQDTHVGVKASSSPESVLHALLQSPTGRLKLLPKSPYPAGLVVTGEFMFGISAEHSYSQPTSLLSGLSGACPQVPPPVGCVESLLSLNPGLLKLPDQTRGLAYQEKGGKNGGKYLSPLSVLPPSDPKAKRHFLRHRKILEKEGSIQVTRLWREKYDFGFDSKFTNEKLDKTVTRALHGKWDFSIEDNYEQVHLIFHMWIGLFYSRSTSRFFHFDNCPPLDKNVTPIIGPNQPGVVLPDAGLSSKEDKTTNVLCGPDILDLSLKATGPVSQQTLSQGNGGEDQKKHSSKRSKPVPMMERKELAVRANCNLSLTDSTVDDLGGHSVPDSDDYSDIENDNVTETSYTKLLENNSAYSHLCEQTFSMHIDQQKSSKNNEPVCRNLRIPEALRMKGAGRTATNLDAKALAVFHQVVGPARPVIQSKMLDKVHHGKKIIIKSLSFKDKCGDRTPASVSSESVSKDEEHESALGGKSGGSAPVLMHCNNNKDEGTFANPAGHSSVRSVAVHGGNDDTKLDSLPNARNDIATNVHTNKRAEKVVDAQVDTTGKMQDKSWEQVSSMPDARHDTSKLDVQDDMSVNKVKDKILETTYNMNVTTDEVRNYTPVNTQVMNDDSGDRGTPVHSIREDTPVDVQDVNDDAKNRDTPVHSVRDDTLIDAHIVNNAKDDDESAKNGVTAVDAQVVDAKDDITLVNVQDDDESAKDGVTPVHSVTDDTPVDVQVVNEAKDDIPPVEVQDDNKSAKDGVTPVDVQVVNDAKEDIAPVDVHDDDAEDGDKPEYSVQDTPGISDATMGGVKPIHSVRDGTPVNVQDDDESAEDGVTSVDGILDGTRINDASMDGVKPVHRVRDDEQVNVQDVNYAKVGGTHDVKDDTPVDVQDVNKSSEDGVTPVDDVQHDTPTDVQNVNDGMTPLQRVSDYIPVDKQNVNVGDALVESVNDTSVDVQMDVNDSETGATLVHSVRDDTTVQDGNDERQRNEKAEPKSVVRDCGSASECADVHQTEGMAVEVRKSNDMKEHTMQNDDHKTHEENELLETMSEKQKHIDNEPSLSSLEKEFTEPVLMEVFDKNNLEEMVGKVHGVNVSGGETLVEHISSIKGKDVLKLHEALEKSDLEKTRHYAQPKTAAESSADQVSSKAHYFLLTEGHTSSAIGGMHILTKNDKSTRLSPVVQNETPEISLTEPKGAGSDVSFCTAVTNQEAAEESYLAILHASETPKQKVEPQKDHHLQESGTGQKHLAPTICESFSEEIPKMSSGDSWNVSAQAVRIYSKLGMMSRSSTPTQDELPYTRGECEDFRNQEVENLQDNHSSEQALHSVSRSPTIAGLTLDSSVCLNTSMEKHISSSPCYRGQYFSQGPHWSSSKCETATDLTDESKSLTHKPVSSQNLCHMIHESISPREESQSQRHQCGNFSEQYEELSSEELCSWAHSSKFRTDGPHRLREPYASDQISKGFPAHFSINVHRDSAYMPKQTAESESHMPDWVHQIHSASSKSTVYESNESFPFRHRSDLSLSESNEESPSHNMPSICYSKKKSNRNFCQDEWDEDFDGVIDYSIKKTFSCGVEQTKHLKTRSFSPYQRRGESKPTFDWRRYFRREGVFKSSEGTDGFVHDPPSSIVTVFDKKGNRVIFENPSTLKCSIGAHSMSLSVEDSFHNWEDQQLKPDVTQSLMELEYLVFSEKINQMLKNSMAASKAKPPHRPNVNLAENLMTIQFSRLDEEDAAAICDDTWPAFPKFKINVDMSERKGMRKMANYGKPLHLQSLFCEKGNMASCSRISDITKECAKSYSTTMNDVCAGKTISQQNNEFKGKQNIESAACKRQSGFCGRIKKDMCDNLHDNLNSIVRQACKIKYNFYILVTSSDTFFEETKELLEAEGHTAIEPHQFDIDGSGQTPLLILLRNEDIAEHICEVPHLLELKKSSRVLFAGIDRPDDVVNLTHQELFARGGFVVFDEAALDTLTLDNLKKVVGVLEELDKKGKWKWFLHYRDSRKLRENSRCSPEAQKRKHFIDCCREAGLVEGLPYHGCDVISRDKPDYLRCLVHLQIQNVSARFPVFITDTPADSFGKNGILTMNIYTFSRILSNDTCSVS